MVMDKFLFIILAGRYWRRTFCYLLTALFISFPSWGFAGAFVVFGPESFTRGSGSPVTEAKNFTVLKPTTDYTLRISNGGLVDGELERVSSSVISLNGVQIVGPNEFNQNISVIEKPVTLAANNELAVELRGKPGGSIALQIIGVDDDPPSVSINSPADGATVDASPVTVTGTVNDTTSGIADVTCNGTQALVSDSSFNCDVSLVDGPNTVLVEATDLTGNVGSLSITVNLATGLTVAITSPAPGSVINASTVIVQGVVDVPAGTEAGVTVNGFVGLVADGRFAAIVPVDPSVMSLTATVTNATGSSGSDTAPVSVQPAPSGSALLFRPSPAVGLAPLSVDFNLVNRTAIAEVSLDLEGDGTTDFTGPALEGQAFVYSTPGLYFPTVVVTDTAGVTQTASALVLVYDQTTFDTFIQNKWQGMKSALRQGDIEGALEFISLSKRESYGRMLEALGPQTADIDQILTDISFVEHQGLRAEYQMIRIDEEVRISHFVLFVLDNDGIWRIKFF
jgi:hypothetical protein